MVHFMRTIVGESRTLRDVLEPVDGRVTGFARRRGDIALGMDKNRFKRARVRAS